jgi:hypothetical protein
MKGMQCSVVVVWVLVCLTQPGETFAWVHDHVAGFVVSLLMHACNAAR